MSENWTKDDRGLIVAPPIAEYDAAAFPNAVLVRIMNKLGELMQVSLIPEDARALARLLVRAANDAGRTKR
jgi:hypothetical protein